MSKNVSEVLGASMAKVREMVDANTVIGEPIQAAEGVTLIPVSKISFALASGGSDMVAKAANLSGSFAGGTGCGVKITPVALITIQGERVRVLPIDEPASTAAERVIEQLPGLVDKISELISAKKSEITDN